MNRYAIDNADISNTSWNHLSADTDPSPLLVRMHPTGHYLPFFRESDHAHRRVETGKRNGGAPTSCTRKKRKSCRPSTDTRVGEECYVD